MDRRYNAGLYLRLSVEDNVNSAKRGRGNPFQGESASIENQRDILTKYIRLRGWNVAKEYADDGYAGGSFNRPAFQEMVSDAEVGLIDLILVKDLSRLGRDHIEVDSYAEDVFPSLGVRFIALMDNIYSEGSAEILPFRSLLNDYHLKDLSRKTKSVLHAKAKAGDYVGAFAPYGYKKDPARHGRLMVDPYAAEVVSRIFDLRLQKMGYHKIAAALNADGILAPRAYCYEYEGREYNASKVWTDKTIKLMLENEVYLGHSVKMKKGTLSYKNKRQINKPPEEWIRAEYTHPAIIDKDVWDEVQGVNLMKYDPDTRKPSEPSLFSGMLVCADCGRPMICNTETHRRNGQVFTYHSYLCSTRKRTGNLCSWHTIYEKTLLRIIREDLQLQLERISFDEERIINEIQSRTSSTAYVLEPISENHHLIYFFRKRNQFTAIFR